VWLALVPLAALCVYADSIDVEITPARTMIVRENFSRAGSHLIFLASSCARIEKIQSADGSVLRTSGPGPWMTVSNASMPLSYEAVPLASPRICSVPLLMPEHPIDSVRLTITDHGSGVTRVGIPHVEGGAGKWTATFPAVPSQVQLEWPAGAALPKAPLFPIGRFAWNFWGLVSVLVLWTVAYLIWARRGAGSS